METKRSIFDIVFTVVMCALWLTLGIVWVSSFDPSFSLFPSVCFCGAILFLLPVALVVMVAVIEYIDSRKK